MRGVHLRHQKAARIHGTGIERQQQAQHPVGGDRAVVAREVDQVAHGPRITRRRPGGPRLKMPAGVKRLLHAGVDLPPARQTLDQIDR